MKAKKSYFYLALLFVSLSLLLSGCAGSTSKNVRGELDLDYIAVEKSAEEEAEEEPWYAWFMDAFSFGSVKKETKTAEKKVDSVAEIYEQGEAPEAPVVEEEEEEQEEQPEAKEIEADDSSTKDIEEEQKVIPDQEEETETPEVKEPEEKKNTVTMHIRCDTAVNNGMHLESKWAGIVPASGCILDTTTFEIEDGDTVFDVLCMARDKYKLHMEYSGAGSGIYVEGINNLYEFDGGRWSGWMYCVNDWYPNYGCGVYYLKAGDVIEWNYTCDLGCDLENGDPYGYGKEWKDTHD